jgi:very-short-patch-repair endonuclease
MAAVLACGEGAVLSHRSAAALWGIRPWSSVIEVTVPGGGGRAIRKGLLVHRSRRLAPGEKTREHRIPVTTPARTIADLRAILPPDHLHAAIRRAEFRRLDIGYQPGYEPDLTRSELERKFLRLCRRHGLPLPEVNVPIESFLVDFLWPAHSLIVETDGFSHHGTRSAFESDRERDARLRALGYTVIRFTYRRVTKEPRHVASTLRALLAQCELRLAG